MPKQPHKLKPQPVTSISDDRLLCLFGPDAFLRLCPLLRSSVWQLLPDVDRDARMAHVAARLALMLVAEGSSCDERLIHYLAQAQFKHLCHKNPAFIQFPVEDAVIAIPSSYCTALLAGLFGLTSLRGLGIGRNRLGEVDADQYIVDQQKRKQFIRLSTHAANRLLHTSATAISIRPPTFSQFTGLARSHFVQIQGKRICEVAVAAGLLQYQPLLDPIYLASGDESWLGCLGAMR